MAWFDDVFLPSLFKCPRPKGFLWLSENQTECFIRQRGVESHQFLTQNTINGGFYVFGGNYTYDWNGRKVSVFPCKSGISRLYFGQTEEEKQQFWKLSEQKSLLDGIEKAIKMKGRNPKRFSEKLMKATENLLICIKCFDACAASEDDEELEDALFDLEEAEKSYYKYYFA